MINSIQQGLSLDIEDSQNPNIEGLNSISRSPYNFDFGLQNWFDGEANPSPVTLTVFLPNASDVSKENSNEIEARSYKSNLSAITLRRHKRGSKRRSRSKKKRVARHKNRNENLTRQIPKPLNRNDITKGTDGGECEGVFVH